MHTKNHPVAVAIDDDMLVIRLKGSGEVRSPLGAFPWLQAATPAQQNHVELLPFSVYWPDLNNGIDIHALITGEWTQG